MEDYEKLWGTAQLIQLNSPLSAATLQLELDQYRDKLLNFFHNKVGMLRNRPGRVLSCQQAGSRSGLQQQQHAVCKATDRTKRGLAECVLFCTCRVQMLGCGSRFAQAGCRHPIWSSIWTMIPKPGW